MRIDKKNEINGFYASRLAKFLLWASLSLSVGIAFADKESFVLGGMKGAIFPDGSGSIGSPKDFEMYKDVWNLEIKKDEISDEVRATVRRYAFSEPSTHSWWKVRKEGKIHLLLNIFESGGNVLCVGGHNPSLSAAIRIDDLKAIGIDPGACIGVTPEIDSQLRKGTKIILRGYPGRGGSETKTILLDGYGAVVDFMRQRLVQASKK